MRTQDEIYREMEAVQSTIPALAGTTTNRNSTVGYLKYMWATLVQNLDRDVDRGLLAIQEASNAYQIGSLSWYVQQAKAFQYGQPTTVIDGRVGYLAIEPLLRIVKQAAAVEDDSTGRLTIKAVKAANGGLLTPLSTDELSAFKAYMGQVKYAGVPLDVLSLNADELKLNVTVRVDPKVLAPSGASLTDPTKRPVEVAIANYLRSIPYDSVLTWTALTDYMQQQPGVLDFTITSAAARLSGVTPFTDFVGNYTSAAGHMIVLIPQSTFTYK